MDSLGQSSVNDFRTDLEFSLKKNDDKLINEKYFEAFPHLEKILVVNNLKLQKRGIDKIFIMTGGKRIMVDEKKRRKNYDDILLEEYSDFERKIVGWLDRKKYTDYISYIIWPKRKLYLLPFLLLQKAWLANYHQWLLTYGRKFAKNKNYTTSNIPIPTKVLLNVLKETLLLNL
mgnify:CR=1 FL=1